MGVIRQDGAGARRLWKSGGWRTATANLGALTAIQAGNGILPLLIFPYAYAVLGPDVYAQVVTAESVVLIVLTLSLFSFEIDGVAMVADLSLDNDRDALARLVGSVRVTQLALFAIASSAAVVGYMALVGGPLHILLLWLMFPLGYTLQSTWLYQGLERNVPIAVIIVAARLVAIGSVFLFVRDPGDAWIVPAAIGGSFMLAGFVSMLYVRSIFGLRFRRPEVRQIVLHVRQGKEICLANGSVLIYRGLNVLVLGAGGAAPAAISVYSVAEKITRMVQAIARPLSQFVFPRLLRRLAGHKAPDRAAARIITNFTWPQLALLGALLLMVGAGLLLAFDHGLANYPNVGDISLAVTVMLPAMFFGIANFMFGLAGLSYLGARKYLLYAMTLTGAVNIVVCIMLAEPLQSLGGALAVALSEMLLFAMILMRYLSPRRTSLLSVTREP